MLIILSLSRKKNPLLASFGSTREIIFCYYSLQDLLLIFFSSSIEPAIRPDLCSKLEKILKCSKHNCNFSYDIRQLEKKNSPSVIFPRIQLTVRQCMPASLCTYWIINYIKESKGDCDSVLLHGALKMNKNSAI